MSHSNRVKNASKIIGKQKLIMKRNLSKNEQFALLQDKTSWSIYIIEKVINALDFTEASEKTS